MAQLEGRRQYGPEHVEVQRPRLEALRAELRSRGYEAVVDVDRRHGSGWVLRVQSPREDLPNDLRCKATLTLWYRQAARTEWTFEWPYAWPLRAGAEVCRAADFVSLYLGPTSRAG